MKKNVEVFQIGTFNWKEKLPIPVGVSWTFRRAGELDASADDEEQSKRPKSYDVVILDCEIGEWELPLVMELGSAYTYFYTDNVPDSDTLDVLKTRKLAAAVSMAEVRDFLEQLPVKYFRGQEGSKFGLEHIRPAKDLQSRVRLDGNRALILEADLGDEFRPVLGWKYNVIVDRTNPVELWPEYQCSGSMEVQFKVRHFRGGELCSLLETKVFSERELEQPVVLTAEREGYLSCELLARGSGRLEMGRVHFRRSRLGAGQFLAGGRRYADPSGRELISYFDPGDLKPPLNVYFSGYRTAEGFEGYFIMKQMKSPFLLIGDPWLEGGGFYLGSPEYEGMVEQTIRDTLDKLGFTNRQLVLSGMSMGTFGASYYATALSPRAVILGKPLVNLGDVAANEKRLRPGGFPTSLDVLRCSTGGNLAQDVHSLNERFWQKFDAADFSCTEFAISYMYQDDYDKNGYPDILRHLRDKNIPIVSKGVEGRHNDNTTAIVMWFMSQYRRIMREDFDRRCSG